ncbi:MAG: glutathione S-transferase family protein [Bdellovibrionia bacterium]
MQSIVLYSYRRCPFAMRVRMTLEEKNLTYLVIEENLNSFSSELLRLHPEGKVPVLLHDQQVIYESSIITEYLDEVFPSPMLMPKSPKERAQVRLWTYWCNELFKPDLDEFKYEWKSLNEEKQLALKGRLLGHLEKLESGLTDKEFIMGSDLTLADIHLFPFYRQLKRVQSSDLETAPFVRLNTWLEKILARPSFERAMKKK